MAGRIFFSNVVCLLIRLLFVFFAIPVIGMQGYLWGILVSQLVLAGIYFSVCTVSSAKTQFSEFIA